MVTLNLSGFELKIERALTHLRGLVEAERQYGERSPFAGVYELQESPPAVITRARLKVSPPAEVSILVGECIHQLRSALDHLAYEFARARGAQPNASIAFTVATSHRDFEKRTRRQLPNAPIGAVDFLRSLQPFNFTHNEATNKLWLLTTLDNIDKHRMLLVTSAALCHTVTDLEVASGLALRGNLVIGPVQDGGELTRFALKSLPNGRQTRVLGRAKAIFTFGPDTPVPNAPVLETLKDLRIFVEDTADRMVAMAAA